MRLAGRLLSAVLLLGSHVACVPVETLEIEARELQLQLQLELETPPPTLNELAPVEEDDDPSAFTIPSRYESTVLGRRLLGLSKTGILTTVFPENITSDRVPAGVANTPIGLPDYIASCEEPSGNPTLLALTVSTSTQNALAGSNVSLTLSWWDQYAQLTHHQPWSAANLPRLNLVGYLEKITDDEVKSEDIAACFTKAHGDSVLWLPGKKWAAHKGLWVRLVVREIYWIGGFGDRNFIGWFDRDEWAAVKVDEWLAARLPGEK
ncbi:hypothetical protein A1O3_03467 [Capronia epimyces CBS 606.96]|uniref:CREG-like beta-barrel domain-containing protein n=1 Tax=Capronia epimyces CBS 606.96 TaxID=1182542 RepID=W9YB91_9EURO|nr:uncharacterized protein A1O3_03467 [Capronia epimyces CBS 606.96]EXJ86516.1 hypothetical protein A1O3_03467 [Capronia epimyces CBS 606.96]